MAVGGARIRGSTATPLGNSPARRIGLHPRSFRSVHPCLLLSPCTPCRRRQLRNALPYDRHEGLAPVHEPAARLGRAVCLQHNIELARLRGGEMEHLGHQGPFLPVAGNRAAPSPNGPSHIGPPDRLRWPAVLLPRPAAPSSSRWRGRLAWSAGVGPTRAPARRGSTPSRCPSGDRRRTR